MPDNVTSEHIDYQAKKSLWHKCRTVIEGEEAVKEAGELYLPSLTNQSLTEYTAYKSRALFYEATGRTLQGLLGALHHEPPSFTDGYNTTKSDFFDALVPSHIPFKSFIRDLSEEVLTTGRVGILVDIEKNSDSSKSVTPYLCSYCAEDIINWRIDLKSGEEVLSLVVLKEKEPQTGQFEVKLVDRWRVLELVNGVYQQTIWKKLSSKEEYYIEEGPIVPTKSGVPLDHIPFFFINSGGNTAYTYRPPLLGLANVNLSHYRNSADLEHGRHFTGLPTAWIAGFETDEKTSGLQIGSSTAWISSNPNARAGYLEFTGQGLSTLERALQDKESLMAILGARLLESPKNVSESADNQIIRRSSENSMLANLADIMSEGTTSACREAAEWMGLDASKVSITVQREYIDLPVDASFMAQLTQALQAGTISYDTYFYNMQRMKVMPKNRTADNEQDLIEVGRFGGIIIPQATSFDTAETVAPPTNTQQGSED